jgi:hypothetical protein
MFRLQLIIVLVSFFSISGFSQIDRIIDPETKTEMTKTGVNEYLSEWAPRLEEAISLKDTKSMEAISGRILKDLKQMKAELPENSETLDKTYLAYLNRLDYMLSEGENYPAALIIMQKIIDGNI